MDEQIGPAGPPRRLTRDEARQRTRERLLDAAAVVFMRRGYEGASLDAVAEAAGYTKGAVYSNFATKADLFVALLERFFARESEIQGGQLGAETIEEFVDALDVTFERQTRANPDWVLLEMEFWLAAARDPEIRRRYLEGAEDMRDISGRTLDAKIAEIGLAPPFSGRELGILLNALGTGLAIEFYLDPQALDSSLLVRAARLLFGLDPAGPRGSRGNG